MTGFFVIQVPTMSFWDGVQRTVRTGQIDSRRTSSATLPRKKALEAATPVRGHDDHVGTRLLLGA